MKEQLKKRLQELKHEFESGQEVLADLEIKKQNLQNTLLRIQGAIQVIEEELDKSEKLGNNSNPISKPEIEVY
jgi:predicted  nucleic acid-binding Zn-ribbon protein